MPILLFDFGTILVGLSKERCISALQQIGCGRIAYYVDECRQEDLFHELEIGGSIEAFCEEARRQSSYTDENGVFHPCTATDEEICWAWNQLLTDIPHEKLRLIHRLHHEKGYRTAILSNTNQIHWQYAIKHLFTADGLQLEDYFDHAYLSCDLGMVKPDDCIYQTLLTNMQKDFSLPSLCADEVLFIDDSARNCMAAERNGLRTIYDPDGSRWMPLLDGLGGFAAVIGNFDGVHRGHQHVLSRLKEVAWGQGLTPLVITFDRHPRQVFDPAFRAEFINTIDEKEQLLAGQGVRVWIMSFTRQLADTTARDFIHRILHDGMGVKTLLLGYDNRFGKRNDSETFADYERYGQEAGIQVLQVNSVDVEIQAHNTVRASSSVIRRMIREGRMEEAAQCLGRTFSLTGTVKAGHQEGRKIGSPTANISAQMGKILPHDGVYITQSTIGDKQYRSVTNIGLRPTYNNGKDRSIETHIIGFNGDLYGHEITVHFLHFLREEQRFDTVEALRQQIQKDIFAAKEF